MVFQQAIRSGEHSRNSTMSLSMAHTNSMAMRAA